VVVFDHAVDVVATNECTTVAATGVGITTVVADNHTVVVATHKWMVAAHKWVVEPNKCTTISTTHLRSTMVADDHTVVVAVYAVVVVATDKCATITTTDLSTLVAVDHVHSAVVVDHAATDDHAHDNDNTTTCVYM